LTQTSCSFSPPEIARFDSRAPLRLPSGTGLSRSQAFDSHELITVPKTSGKNPVPTEDCRSQQEEWGSVVAWPYWKGLVLSFIFLSLSLLYSFLPLFSLSLSLSNILSFIPSLTFSFLPLSFL
jgi:hypothetical protein